MVKMKIGSTILPPVECDSEDALEEIEELPHEEGAYLTLEDDEGRILGFGRTIDEKYAVICGGKEVVVESIAEIKKIVEDFFAGKLPEFVDPESLNFDYFPDSIDDILKW